MRQHWEQHGRAEKLLISFHGVPAYTLDKGDPYHCLCHKTGRLLTEALGLSGEQYLVSFQSRFGAAEWIKPYTAPTLSDWGKQGIASVDVICPGFAADCLETLEEIIDNPPLQPRFRVRVAAHHMREFGEILGRVSLRKRLADGIDWFVAVEEMLRRAILERFALFHIGT